MRRFGLAACGVVLVAAGVSLLALGGPATATRLGRVAGILIVIGLVLLAVAVIGHV